MPQEASRPAALNLGHTLALPGRCWCNFWGAALVGVLNKLPTRCQWAAMVESHRSRARPAPQHPDGETEALEETGWASATNQLNDLNLPFPHPEMRRMNRPKPTLMYLSHPRAYESVHSKGSNHKEVWLP